MPDIQITVADRCGRRCASSGSKWEPIMGYSRAVRSGNTIAVTGTVGINADGSYDPSIGKQAARSLAIIRAAIEALPRAARLQDDSLREAARIAIRRTLHTLRGKKPPTEVHLVRIGGAV